MKTVEQRSPVQYSPRRQSSAQHTEKQRPAAHYNNKIHVDTTLSSLMFTLKRTAKKVSLQLSFERKQFVGVRLGDCSKLLDRR